MLDTFYRAVLPGRGCYALFDGPRKRHVWCDSIDALTRETLARVDQPDLYFATASFNEPTERTIANALYRRAFCFDIDAGAAKLAKHGDKVYETQRDAIAALLAWARSSGVLPSWLVSSGNGLHAYFLLGEDADVADWLPVAKTLKGMALAQGLRIDPAVTGDPARVLRPPGSLHNSGARVAVLNHGHFPYSLQRLKDLTAGFTPAPPVREKSANSIFLDRPEGPPRVLAKVTKHCAAMAHAVNSRGDVSEPYWRGMLGIIKFTVDGAVAAHAASEGHPDYDYDATQAKFDRWTAGPTTCALFEEENRGACAGCRFHGKIKSPIVLGELNNAEVVGAPVLPSPAPASAEPADVPWTVVDETDSASTDAEPAPRLPWHEQMPEGFRVVSTPAGGHLMVAKRSLQVDDDTDETGRKKKTIVVDTPFAAVPFWFESWAAGSHDGDQALATYCVFDKTRYVVTRYTMPTKLAAQRETLLGALASQNVQVYPSTQAGKQIMEDFVKASLERIRSAGQRQKILERFGTMFNERGNLVVAQGKYLIAGDGSVTEGVVQEKLKARASAYVVPMPKSLHGSWSTSNWKSHVMPLAQAHIAYLREFYSDPNFSPYQLAIMLAWASPMLAFMQGTYHPGGPLPGIGLTVSLYSPISGIGKTAAMHAAALAFGSPNGLVLQLDRPNSTDFARQMLLLQCGTMPSFMDEMEDVEPKDLANLISTVGNGATRQRIDPKTMQITGGIPVSVLNMMSTNKSHREIAAADRSESSATQMRLLEINCSRVLPVNAARSQEETRARSRLQESAGAVGALLHYAMCSMGPDKLNALGVTMAGEARAHMSGEQDGRFLWRGLGAMMAVRGILAGLGLKVFDDAVLIKEFKFWHDEGYAFTDERILPTDGVDLMSMMLSDLAGKTLITFDMTDMRKKNAKYDTPLNDRVPDDVVARSVLDEHCVYLKTDALRDWAFKKKVSYRTIINRCRDASIIDRPNPGARHATGTSVDLFKGTKLSQGVRSFVVKVDLTKLGGLEAVYDRHIGDNVRELKPARVTPERTAAAPRSSDPASG